MLFTVTDLIENRLNLLFVNVFREIRSQDSRTVFLQFNIIRVFVMHLTRKHFFPTEIS